MTPAQPKFGGVVIDVDSTLSGIEGIDWLARGREEIIAREIESLTERAMRGEIALERVYGARLAAIRPNRADIHALAAAYIEALAPDAADVITRMRDAGVRVALVSGGLRDAILPMARELGFNDSDVRAVTLQFDESGQYSGFDDLSPLTTAVGKSAVIAELGFPAPVMMVGDGMTDLATRDVVQLFAAYTGFVSREAVVAAADKVLGSFRELENLVIGWSHY